jgi:hypothetical protein
VGWPIDTNFTTFVNYNAVGPSTPGAADIDRLGSGVTNLANMPSITLGRQDVTLVSSALSFNRLLWKNIISQVGTGMVVANSTGNPGDTNYQTDRIYLPYPGEVEFKVIVDTQTNNTAGYGQLSVSVSFNSTYPDSQQDRDYAENTTAHPSVLRCGRRLIVGQTQVNAGIALVVDYAQNSGGVNSIVASYPAFPLFQVSYVGKGGQA